MNPRAHKENVLTEQLVDETIVYDTAGHKAHCLNKTVSAVWSAADGSKTVDEIAAVVSEKLQASVDREVVLLALDELKDAGLLVSESFTPAEGTVSRRDLARKLAMGGLAASLIPAVASVMAPTPAMAASVNTSYTPQWFNNEKNTVWNDIQSHQSQYNSSFVAQVDYGAGVVSGDAGDVATLLNQNAIAQTEFQIANNDFNGVLKALGLPPL